jgi:hypothetical protein
VSVYVGGCVCACVCVCAHARVCVRACVWLGIEASSESISINLYTPFVLFNFFEVGA